MHPEGDAAGVGNEARVEEQSHKDEMRAALRGDFERLRARHESRGEAEGVPGPVVMSPAANVLPAAQAELRTSWLDRLRGRC